MPGFIAPVIAKVLAVVVVPLHVALLLLDEVLIFTVYPSHAVHADPSLLNVNVTLFVLAPPLAVAVNVAAAATLNVVLAVVALVIVVDVLLVVQIVPVKAYPVAAVAAIACA